MKVGNYSTNVKTQSHTKQSVILAEFTSSSPTGAICISSGSGSVGGGVCHLSYQYISMFYKITN